MNEQHLATQRYVLLVIVIIFGILGAAPMLYFTCNWNASKVKNAKDNAREWMRNELQQPI